MDRHTQVAVVGGGLVGRVAAIAIARLGLGTLHIAPDGPEDWRTSALMGPSIDLLVTHGLVDRPEDLGVPLKAIRIIDATGRFPRAPETLFEASEAGLERFGWNFANARLAETFDSVAAGIDTLASSRTLLQSARRGDGVWHLETADGERQTAGLLVGADGRGSRVRDSLGIAHSERAHRQSALVCDLELARPLGATSVEFHYPEGPFTLVPAGDNRANLVWIDRPEILDASRRTPEDLVAAIAERSQNLFGTVTVKSGSFVYPLSSIRVRTAGRNSGVLVGEAAHGFPPIGAQGLNLGLRDVGDLVAALRLANTGAYAWGEPVARSYARMRAGDLARTGQFVDSLFGSLVAGGPAGQGLRSAGLWALNALPALRRQAIAFGLGRG
ncbi:FAD-dependent monooxygenase [Pelagibacterium montanilacus]|uniref:FAD-dependent monooxygenase n=1 Tax=Pelagibacterium montanilacus TaxID=2185280 RepID=UPI0013DF8A1A|nr:FAD-dependent monooxygenase [Pelagibacterium montanilacus]